MSNKFGMLILGGFLWLLLFSIPVGQGKTLFDVAHHYIVNSGPVHWIVNQFNEKIAETDRNRAPLWLEESREKLSRSEPYYDFSE